MNILSTRRDFLKLALSSGIAFGYPMHHPLQAKERGKARPRSLILLWLAGGASQLETWDPHPNTKFGGPTKAISTTLPDLKIAEYYPRVAEQIHHLSVIRSMISEEGDHERGTYYLKTGYRPDQTLKHPALGAIAAHQHPDLKVEIPLHISLANGPWPARP